MKIIHVMRVIGIAGAEGHLLRLLPGLRAAGIDARMIVLEAANRPTDDLVLALQASNRTPGDFVAALRARDVPVELMTTSLRLDLTLTGRLRERFRAERPDIVHTHLIHADTYGTLAARSAGVTHVVSSRHNPDRFRRWLPFRWLNRALLARTDKAIAISGALAEFTYRYEGAKPGQVATIYYGLEPWRDDGRSAARRADLRREWGIPEDAPVVGSVCRLIEQKGLRYAISAFAQVHERIPAAHYVIAGEGQQHEQLMAQAQALGLGERVHFLGWRPDAPAIYDAIDVFLMPSIWEGFGLVLLEAMGHCLPIVGSSAGAIPEVVIDGETGFIAPPADSAALVEPLARLLGDPELRRNMGQAGRARLESTFSVGKMVEETIRLYRSLGL